MSEDAISQARELFLEWLRTRPADTYQSSIMSTEAERLWEMIADAITAARAQASNTEAQNEE